MCYIQIQTACSAQHGRVIGGVKDSKQRIAGSKSLVGQYLSAN